MRNWGKKGGICVILKNIVMGCSSGVLIFRILTFSDVILKSSVFVTLYF